MSSCKVTMHTYGLSMTYGVSLLLVLIGGGRSQESTRTVLVKTGDAFEINCTTGSGVRSIVLIKESATESTTIATYRKGKRVNITSEWKSRVTFRYNGKRSVTLEVPNMKYPNDYGEYQCQHFIKKKAPKIIRAVVVVVRLSNLRLRTSSNGSLHQPVADQLTLTEGASTTVEVRMRTSDVPNIAYTWRRDDVVIQTGASRQITLRQVDRTWTGSNFSCVAETEYDKIGKNATIVVNYAPEVTSINQEHLDEELNNLTCLVTKGYPAIIHVTWYQAVHGREVRKTKRRKTKNGSSSLVIRRTDFFHNGQYSCLADNGLNSTVKHIAVSYNTSIFTDLKNAVIAERKSAVLMLASFMTSGGMHTARWTRKGREISARRIIGETNGTKDVIWFNKTVRMPIYTAVLTIRDVEMADAGNYTCSVKPQEGDVMNTTISLTVVKSSGNPRSTGEPRSTREPRSTDEPRSTGGPKFTRKTERKGKRKEPASETTNVPLLAGVVCGVAVGAIIITVVVVIVLGRTGKTPPCCRKRKKKKVPTATLR